MSNPNRVQPGVPTGGQFAPTTHAESDVVLEADPRESMQTDGPIQRLNLSVTNRPIMWLLMAAQEEDRLDVDQPYQRGLVWDTERKQKLIRSMLEGVPIPSLIVNDRFSARFTHPGYSDGRNWATAIIDGKQRSNAIIGLARDEYAIPASWIEPRWIDHTEQTDDGEYVRWSGMSDVGRRFFQNITVGVSEGRFATLADEQEIFDRVNFGGVAQGESDFHQ